VDAAVVSLKMVIRSVGQNHHFQVHNCCIQFWCHRRR